MIALDQAFRIVDETLADVRVGSETVPVRSAVGRVLTSDQVSRLDLPPFDKSAMDGYALLADDVHDEYRLLETVAAGQTPTANLAPGCTVKVMTGAAVPSRTDRVIRIEHAEEHNGIVRIRRRENARNVCHKAEDVRRGQTILTAGTTLGVLEIANLIACGVTEVEVARRVRTVIISTGDELVDSPALLKPGKIMNVNGPLLAELCRECGLVVAGEECLPDEKRATIEGIRAALDRAEVIVLSGGVSAGDFDNVGQALGEAGLNVHFSRVAVKPGAPMTYASGRGKAVFGLPGNPVTAYLMFHLFVLRAVALLTGGRRRVGERILRLGCDFECRKTPRVEYVPCRLTREAVVEAVECHGSAHLAALLKADGFFVVPKETVKLNPGDEVTFVPIIKPWSL